MSCCNDEGLLKSGKLLNPSDHVAATSCLFGNFWAAVKKNFSISPGMGFNVYRGLPVPGIK